MEDDRNVGTLKADHGGSGRSAHVRQVEIHQDHFGFVTQSDLRGACPSPGDAAHPHVCFTFEDSGDRRAEERVVLHDHDLEQFTTAGTYGGPLRSQFHTYVEPGVPELR